MRIALIWSELSGDCEMMISSLTQSVIKGEVSSQKEHLSLRARFLMEELKKEKMNMGHSWASTAAPSPSLVSEEAAREQLNLRSFARLTTPANLPSSALATATFTGDGSVLPTVLVPQVLPGVIQVGVIICLKYDFFIFIFCLF